MVVTRPRIMKYRHCWTIYKPTVGTDGDPKPTFAAMLHNVPCTVRQPRPSTEVAVNDGNQEVVDFYVRQRYATTYTDVDASYRGKWMGRVLEITGVRTIWDAGKPVELEFAVKELQT